MESCLVLIGGVSDHAYLLDQLTQCKHLWRKLVGKYGRQHIYNLEYQHIMDRHAIMMKSILDPVRLALTPNGWAAERYVEDYLKDLSYKYDKIDVITHSQGSWMIMKTDVKLNTLWNIANPIGWFAPIARMMVQMNIWSPKVEVNNLFYLYSTEDFVSKRPPKIKGKWTCKADYVEVIDTKTSHDARKYLVKLNSHYPWIFN